MKAFKKIVLIILIFCFLVVPFMGTAQAADLLNPDNINSIYSFFGIDTSNPESIQDAIDRIENEGLSGIMGILGLDTSEILDELQAQLNKMSAETTSEENTVIIPTETAEETTTEKKEASTETNHVTEYPSYNYSPESTTAKPLPVKPSKVEANETTTEATSKEVTVEDITTSNTEAEATESDTEKSSAPISSFKNLPAWVSSF